MRTAVRTLAVYGLPRVPGEVAFGVLLALPVVLAAHAGGPELAGFMGLGISLVRMTGALFAPLGKVLLPAATEAAVAGRVREVRRVTLRISVASVLLPALMLLVFIPFAPSILTAYLGPEFTEGVLVVRLLAAGAVPFSLFVVLRNVLDAMEVRALNTRNLIVSVLLVATVGLLGGDEVALAVGTTAGMLLLAVLTTRDAVRLLRRATAAAP